MQSQLGSGRSDDCASVRETHHDDTDQTSIGLLNLEGEGDEQDSHGVERLFVETERSATGLERSLIERDIP